ncbi:MAG: hypothetical protein ACXVA9_03095 [Bdellovibrionales bacterium]
MRNQTLPAASSSPESKAQAIYPHAPDWVSNHGTQYLKDSAVCKTCHGANLDGGSAKTSCTLCHASFPHQTAWARPENHGAALSKMLDKIRADGGDVTQNECVMCHKASTGSAPPGPKSAKNILCNSCHVAVPHNVEMVARDGQLVHHMEFGHARALNESCLNCHRAQADGTQKFMPTLNKCTTCHFQPGVHPRTKWMSEDEADKVDAYLDQLRNPKPNP